MKANYNKGQKVRYEHNGNVYTGVIVKVAGKDLVIISNPAAMELYKAGYSLGDCVTTEQVID